MKEEEVLRINELARIKKERPLTPAEAAEQKALYEKYLKGIRRNIRSQLGTYRPEDFGDPPLPPNADGGESAPDPKQNGGNAK